MEKKQKKSGDVSPTKEKSSNPEKVSADPTHKSKPEDKYPGRQSKEEQR